MRLKDKIALVTGANRGIGLATARAFAEEGAKVVLLARGKAQGEAAAATIPGACFLPGDVSKAADCEGAVAETLRRHGGLDVLVNCAGVIYRGRTAEQTTETEWDDTFAVNVKGAFMMSRAAMPALREGRGNIVNVSSYAGLVGYPRSVAYAASKAAMVNLTRSMALDHGREGVRVNTVCPGSVDTEMIRSAWESRDDAAEIKQTYAERHPLGRIADPDEIARSVLFLACGDASFITGVALPVDGGITAA